MKVVVADYTRGNLSENFQNQLVPTSVALMGPNSELTGTIFWIPLWRGRSGSCLERKHLCIFRWGDSASVCELKQGCSPSQSILHGIKFSKRWSTGFLISDGKGKGDDDMRIQHRKNACGYHRIMQELLSSHHKKERRLLTMQLH